MSSRRSSVPRSADGADVGEDDEFVVSGLHNRAEGGFNQVDITVERLPAPGGETAPILRVERVQKTAGDAYDFVVLPSGAVHQAVSGHPAMSWVDPLVYQWTDGDGRVHQELLHAGDTEATQADQRDGESAQAECYADMAGVETARLEQAQTAVIDAMRDPARQEHPLVFDGPSTWDAGRVPAFWRLFGELERRIPGLLRSWGVPPIEELRAVLGPHMPATTSDGPPRIVHNDPKPGNRLHNGVLHAVIDWDMAAVTRAAPSHAAVMDLAQELNLTGRNALAPTTTPQQWRPTADRWIHANPQAGVGSAATRATHPQQGHIPSDHFARESAYRLAYSFACDLLRGTEGRLSPDIGARATRSLLTILGLPAAPAERIAADLAHTAGRFPVMRAWELRGVLPTPGPWNAADRAAAQITMNTGMFTALRKINGAQIQAAAEVARLSGRNARQVLDGTELSTSVAPRLAADTSAAFGLDIALRRANLDRRATEALVRGAQSGQVSLNDPTTWGRAPGMPHQHQARFTPARHDRSPSAGTPTTQPAPSIALVNTSAAKGFSPVRAFEAKPALRSETAPNAPHAGIGTGHDPGRTAAYDKGFGHKPTRPSRGR
ncbi:hypothetical protein ACIRL2_28330 [Embleya sp. NPDC127516]|uniref:hypothetical protein n=1 Tax=Embleya sp. NPDC127516 TaxID=3363990 RepID=UPI0038125E6F